MNNNNITRRLDWYVHGNENADIQIEKQEETTRRVMEYVIQMDEFENMSNRKRHSRSTNLQKTANFPISKEFFGLARKYGRKWH